MPFLWNLFLFNIYFFKSLKKLGSKPHPIFNTSKYFLIVLMQGNGRIFCSRKNLYPLGDLNYIP